jgi:lipoyl(octanoyl) transferase
MQFLSSPDPVDYQSAVSFMEDRVEQIHKNGAEELIWFLEHPSIYTAGTSAKAEDLRNPQFPVIHTGRGGQYTYHGNGQLIAYVMCDLKKHQQQLDLRAYIQSLEYWIIKSLDHIGIIGKTSDSGVGIWVDTPSGLSKIAAIGVRVRHGITYHGISLNIDPDLSHYQGIVPCGISDLGVTSLKELNISVTRTEIEMILRQNAISCLFSAY